MKKFLAIIMAGAIVLSMAGCSGGNSSANSADSDSQQTSAAARSADAEPTAEPENSTAPSAEPEEETPDVVRIAALKGPTAMGMIKLMDDESENSACEFTIAGAVSTRIFSTSPATAATLASTGFGGYTLHPSP